MSEEYVTRPILKEELEKFGESVNKKMDERFEEQEKRLMNVIDERFEGQEAKLTEYMNERFDNFEERIKHYMAILVEQVRDEVGGGRKDELGYVREKVNDHEERIEKLEGQRA